MSVYEWESIDESEYINAGEVGIAQVNSNDDTYILEMELQAKRVLAFLTNRDTDSSYRIKWYNHDFGQYCQIEKKIEIEDDEESEWD